MIDDATRFAEAADIARMRQAVDEMSQSAADEDVSTFLRTNWELHAAIARTSPSRLLRSVYLSLLDVLASHTVSVEPAAGRTVSEVLAARLALHSDLVEALADRDAPRAKELIAAHNRP